MWTPARALSQAGAGDPLPEVFPALTHAGFEFMRAEVTMIAGQPNAGKSMIALHLADQWDRKGERVLYLSADSNPSTQVTRLLSMHTGEETRSIRRAIADGGGAYYEDFLDEVGIRFDFNTSPTLGYVENVMEAYEETFGDHPTVVIIDNLLNVEGVEVGDNAKSGLMEIQKVFKWWTRETGAAFLVLHHASESEGNPSRPPKRKVVQQKVSELPENILTVAFDPDKNQFGFALAKNRHGKADPEALNPIWVWADFDKAAFFNDRFEAASHGVTV